MAASKKDEPKAKAEAEAIANAPIAEEEAAANDWPEDVADPSTGTNVAPAGPAPATPAPPLEPEPLATPVGYTNVVPVPGSDGPRSQQEYDAGQR